MMNKNKHQLQETSKDEYVISGEKFNSRFDQNETLFSMLERTANKYPDKGITYISVENNESFQSYADLLNDAKCISSHFKALINGDQYVILHFIHNDELIQAFWACQAAGLIPVPVAPAIVFDPKNEATRRLINICIQLPDTVIITDEELYEPVSNYFKDKIKIIYWPDFKSKTSEAMWENSFSPTAMLQFSSGSTGDPKGIVLSHQNIIVCCQQMLAARGVPTEQFMFLNWMPLYHDMGMMGYHMTPIILGASQVHMPQALFLKNPVNWLKAITKFSVTEAGLTNFAIKLLTQFLSGKSHKKHDPAIDLSTLCNIEIGAEPISYPLLNEFVRLCGHYGLEPESLAVGYGLAEATLAATFIDRDKGHSAVYTSLEQPNAGQKKQFSKIETESNSITITCLGKPVPGMNIRIVDSEGNALPPGNAGEVQLAGPNLFQGYLTDKGFIERTETWFSTGDRGFIFEGELYISGRLKDVFIWNGKNFHLTDIEDSVQELEFIRTLGVAVVCDDDRLILFVDIPKEGKELFNLLKEVRLQIQSRMGIESHAVYALSRKKFNRTTSGKIQRFRLLQRLKEGEFDALPVSLNETLPNQSCVKFSSKEISPANNFTNLVASIWSEALNRKIDTHDYDTLFTDMGGTSLKAILIHNLLEQKLNKSISPKLFSSVGTINEVAMLLQREFAEQPPSPLKAFEKKFYTKPSANSSLSVDDPIVIVGYGCRYPGAENPNEMWTLLEKKQHNLTKRSQKRNQLGSFYQAMHSHLDDIDSYGSFFEDIDMFDPDYFSLGIANATVMDPQQRLFLEVVEQACAKTRLVSNNVGIFASSSDDEYGMHYLQNPELMNEHSLLGCLPNMIAAKVAELYGFQGPAISVDTACSSSLYGVHLAIDALNKNECDVAIAGGVHLHLCNQSFRLFAKTGILKQDGPCRPFDDEASGLVPGEGTGVVILKQLSRAKADGDHIYAMIRNSMANNDGKTLSGSSPNPKGKISLLEKVYKESEIIPSSLDYLEAHATGTAIGDAVEVLALQEAFENLVSGCDLKIPIGSVKSNLGHTMTASGITSLLKVILCLQHQKIVPTLFCENPSQRINFPETCFYPITDTQEWPASSDRVRRAGIDSFGLGGTNVHMIIEDYREAQLSVPIGNLKWVSVGGRTPKAWLQRKKQLISRLDRKASFTDSLLRSSFLSDQLMPYRTLICFHNQEEMQNNLNSLSLPEKGEPGKKKIALVFPNSGSLNSEIAYILYQNFSLYKQAIDQCHDILTKYAFDLRSVLFNTEESSDFSEPGHKAWLSCSVSYALYQLLTGLKVEPELIIGHGEGEYAAAICSNMIPLDKALEDLGAQNRNPETVTLDDTATLSTAYNHAHWIPFISTQSGALRESYAELRKLESSRDDITFEQVFQYAMDSGIDTFVELGITDHLFERIQPITEKYPNVVVHSLCVDNQQNVNHTVKVLAALYERGLDLQMERTLMSGATTESLPPAYDRRHIWFEANGLDQSLGMPSNKINIYSHYSFIDHTIYGKKSAPFSFILDWVFKALHKEHDIYNVAFKDVFILSPLFLQGEKEITLSIDVDDKQIKVKSNGEKEHLIGVINTVQTKVFQQIDLQLIKSRCVQILEPEELYKQRSKTGLELGLSLQAIEAINYNSTEVLVKLKEAPEIKGDFTISAAIIDSAMQASVLLFHQKIDDLYLGFGIETIEIYKKIMHACYAYISLNSDALSEFKKCTVIFADEFGEIIGQFKGFTAKKAPNEYRFLEQDNGLQTQSLELIDQLKQIYRKEVDTLQAVQYQEAYHKIDALGVAYIIDALLQMGWQFNEGENFTSEKIIQDLQVVKPQQPLFHRLLEALSEAGILSLSDQGWLILKTPENSDLKHLTRLISEQYDVAKMELGLLMRCGPALAEVLQGKQDPLELIFPEGDVTSARTIYAETVISRTYNTLLRHALEILIKKRSAASKLSILEVGAGTGATTSYLLPYLSSQHVSYVYTDISPYLIVEAEEHFKEYDFVDYQILDIASNPLSQGFEAHQYDIVIASNVLHATQDLRRTLSHVNKLLIPGGTFILLELTKKSTWLDLTFGLTEGWWQFSDYDLRKNYPLISSGQWQTLCENMGFTHCVTLDGSLPALFNNDLLKQCMLFANAPPQNQALSFSAQKADQMKRAIEKLTPQNEMETSQNSTDDIESELLKLIEKKIKRKVQASEMQEHFSNLGIDSIRALDIGAAIQTQFKVKLPATIMFEAQNLTQLANKIKSKLLKSGVPDG